MKYERSLRHVWRQSPAQDGVWAKVAALGPSKTPGRLLMALKLQAFIDESVSPGDGDFVLGGCIASAEKWAEFAEGLEKLLPLGRAQKTAIFISK